MSPSVAFYEITASAVRVCHALPTESRSLLSPLADFLSRWQSLAGAVIGATVSLFVAIIVADRVPRRERRATATALIIELETIRVTELGLRGEPNEERWRFLMAMPMPEVVLRETDLSSLLNVHSNLTAHLLLLRECHRQLAEGLVKYHGLKQEIPKRATTVEERLQRQNRLVQMDSCLADYLSAIARHVTPIEYYLQELILCSRSNVTWYDARSKNPIRSEHPLFSNEQGDVACA